MPTRHRRLVGYAGTVNRRRCTCGASSLGTPRTSRFMNSGAGSRLFRLSWTSCGMTFFVSVMCMFSSCLVTCFVCVSLSCCRLSLRLSRISVCKCTGCCLSIGLTGEGSGSGWKQTARFKAELNVPFPVSNTFPSTCYPWPTLLPLPLLPYRLPPRRPTSPKQQRRARLQTAQQPRRVLRPPPVQARPRRQPTSLRLRRRVPGLCASSRSPLSLAHRLQYPLPLRGQLAPRLPARHQPALLRSLPQSRSLRIGRRFPAGPLVCWFNLSGMQHTTDGETMLEFFCQRAVWAKISTFISARGCAS